MTLKLRNFTAESQKHCLTCDFFGGMESYTIPMTHHVECVAILEPAEKGI
ncbi:hypothetical protein [Streptomyces dangxiongensis]|nr:hypothetical protein [Streptomyces dangxiongensis]